MIDTVIAMSIAAASGIAGVCVGMGIILFLQREK